MDVLWPDFTKEHLEKALEEYSKRNRRFGGV
jgi:undecaprenyl diphosphate synthase